jgi:hypothetical protein
MAKAKSQGTCVLCGYRSGKTGMGRHLNACLVKHAKPGNKEFFHLRVENRWGGPWWLDVEVAGSATFADLDTFLRRLWLECCGHMSTFRMRAGQGKGTARQRRSVWSDEEIGMENRVGDILSAPVELTHVYDFGTSTELSIRTTGSRKGSAEREKIRILARNDPPVWPCSECGAAATQIGSDCGEDGFYCDKHAAAHECGEEMLLPVVNSPRMGVCGYTG